MYLLYYCFFHYFVAHNCNEYFIYNCLMMIIVEIHVILISMKSMIIIRNYGTFMIIYYDNYILSSLLRKKEKESLYEIKIYLNLY